MEIQLFRPDKVILPSKCDCLQTMTTTDTRDVAGTVEQVKRCADMGADIVRITVQGKQEAMACHRIREQLFKDRYWALP